jgi:hypothetical protein
MKPALQPHRSIIFWSGILVMVFLCWAWRDSYRYFTVASEGDWEAVSTRGSLGLGRYQDPSPLRNFQRAEFLPTKPPRLSQCPPHMPVFLHSVPEVPGDTILPERPKDFRGFMQSTLNQHSSPSWLLTLPYWCILLGFFIPWTMLLAWRARRRKRVPVVD